MGNHVLIIGILFIAILVFNRWAFKKKRERRRNYYRNEYLKSDDWKRKRYVVLKRDNWRCVYCGAPATQVHHKKYGRRNIGIFFYCFSHCIPVSRKYVNYFFSFLILQTLVNRLLLFFVPVFGSSILILVLI